MNSEDHVIDMSEVAPFPRVTFADMLAQHFSVEELGEMLAVVRSEREAPPFPRAKGVAEDHRAGWCRK